LTSHDHRTLTASKQSFVLPGSVKTKDSVSYMKISMWELPRPVHHGDHEVHWTSFGVYTALQHPQPIPHSPMKYQNQRKYISITPLLLNTSKLFSRYQPPTRRTRRTVLRPPSYPTSSTRAKQNLSILSKCAKLNKLFCFKRKQVVGAHIYARKEHIHRGRC